MRTPRSNEVDVEAARRIAIHAQALDGSAGGVRETVQRLGFLQLDPIATVATPQELVLWSRLGSFDRTELDRLLWEERALFEWNAFVWPIESLPMVRGLMRRWRTSTHYAHERWGHEFIAANKPVPPLRPPRAREARPSALTRARGQGGRGAARPPLVRLAARGADADGAPPARRGRNRGPSRQAAALGSRRALVSADRGAHARPGNRAARRAALPCARGAAREGAAARASRCRRQPRRRTGSRCSRRSTA